MHSISNTRFRSRAYKYIYTALSLTHEQLLPVNLLVFSHNYTKPYIIAHMPAYLRFKAVTFGSRTE